MAARADIQYANQFSPAYSHINTLTTALSCSRYGYTRCRCFSSAPIAFTSCRVDWYTVWRKFEDTTQLKCSGESCRLATWILAPVLELPCQDLLDSGAHLASTIRSHWGWVYTN